MTPAKTQKPAQVTIVGAGVIGLATAYYAAKAGASVLVLERGSIGDGASSGNAGLVVPSFYEPLCAPGVIGEALGELLNPEGFFAIKPRFDPALPAWLLSFLLSNNRRQYSKCVSVLTELSAISSGLHGDLAAELPLDYEYRQNGLLYVYANPKKLDSAHTALSRSNLPGIQTEGLSVPELLELEPSLAPDLAGAIWYKSDAMLRPERFLASLAKGLYGAGGEIAGQTEVYDFELSGRRITALLTTAGRVPVDQVVLAAGAWLAPLSRRLGKRLPVEGGLGISLTFDPLPDMPRNCFLLDSHGAVTPFAQGLRITGLLRLGGRDMDFNPRRIRGLWRSTQRYLPGLAGARVHKVWRGLRPCLPDGLPVIGRASRFDNLLLAGGHDQKGLSLAPVTGMLMEKLLNGQAIPDRLARALSPKRLGM